MPGVLFVCTGNTCRSPMAMALFSEMLKKARPDWASWRIESAGTWAYDGSPAAEGARAAMAKRDLDLGDHRSRTVNGAMLADFELILTMEFNHKEALRVEFPALAGRVFLLSEMAGLEVEVEDPIGGSQADYDAAAREIALWIERGLPRILALASPPTG